MPQFQMHSSGKRKRRKGGWFSESKRHGLAARGIETMKMDTKGKCKNCKHTIIKTTKRWWHLDRYNQPVFICSSPVFISPRPEMCGCRNAESKRKRKYYKE